MPPLKLIDMSTKINLTNREIDEIFHEVREDGIYKCVDLLNNIEISKVLSYKGILYYLDDSLWWRRYPAHRNYELNVLIDTRVDLTMFDIMRICDV